MLTSCATEVDVAQFKACSEDIECKLAGDGGCCGQEVPVHVGRFEKLNKNSRKECHSMRVICPRVKAVCIKNRCQRTVEKSVEEILNP